jgi:hypothetical protein
MRGALAKRTRYYRVAVHTGALESGSRHHIMRGGSLLFVNFVNFVGVRFSCGGWRIHIFSGPIGLLSGGKK